MVMRELFPEAHIDTLEVDPAVVRVAERFFNFQPDDHMKVHTTDARVFIKRAGLRGEKYDYIMLDAFSGEYIPEHLLSQEFLQEVADILADDGILVANTFASSRLYDHESVTYESVFGRFYALREAGSGNRILLAGNRELPPPAELVSVARSLFPSLRPYGINILEYPARISDTVDWDPSVRVLTDQYSPANLLRD